jgi:hypothetical protein
MTDDLVKRLRESSAAWFAEGECSNSELEREAANRIESQMQLIGASGEAIGAMLARIEELEAALRQISNDGNWGPNGCWEGTSYPDEIARAALGGEKND